MNNMDEFAPCRLVEHENSYSLCFDQFETYEALMDQKELQGGGYTWHAIVDSLVKKHHPELSSVVKYDPEGSMFVAYGSDQAALKKVALLIRQAQEDEAVLLQAIKDADPELLE